MLRRPSLGILVALFLAVGVAQAAEPPAALTIDKPTPAACAAMVQRGTQVWSKASVAKCDGWRKQQQAMLDKAAARCRARHRHDDNLNACDAANDTAQRFGMEVEELLSAGNVP